MRDVIDVRQGASNEDVALAGNREFDRFLIVAGGGGGGESAHRRFN